MFEAQIAKILYKLTVEMDMRMNAVLDCIVDDDYLRRLRTDSVRSVKATNGLLGAKYFARVTLTPQNILSACVLNLSLIGCYGVRGNVRDVYAMLIFGVIGYLLKLYKFNIVPIVLGMILGDIAEEALQQGMILYNNDLWAMFATFFQRPISLTLIILMVVSICAPFVLEYRKKKQARS